MTATAGRVIPDGVRGPRWPLPPKDHTSIDPVEEYQMRPGGALLVVDNEGKE